ncbi:hypothetical protein [Photobacterium leiognathi]|uniref:hypothetical protein n=1 Tax=Photobacterium leiognathi TaxID=553611 RepID=UPI002980DFD6|nr:hypothetical protein [Photobacterium leiognathi]
MKSNEINQLMRRFEMLSSADQKQFVEQLLGSVSSDMLLESLSRGMGLESNTINFAPMQSGRCPRCGK